MIQYQLFGIYVIRNDQYRYIYLWSIFYFFFNEYLLELSGIQNLESIALHIYIYNINNSKLY